MGFKKFSSQVFFRFALLLANLILVSWLIPNSPYVLLPAALIVVAILQIIGINSLISKHNKKLAKFVFSLKHEDYNSNYLESTSDTGFKELNEAFQLINDRLKENRLENESYLHFLNAIVEQIKIGLVTLDEQGEVAMMNQSASRLLEIPNLKKWHRFEEKAPEFSSAVNGLDENEKILLSITRPSYKRQLAIHMNVVKLLGVKHKVITFYDIKNELERKEIDSYNKLISILTHEIMNSVTPLNSLTDTVTGMLKDGDKVIDKDKLNQEDVDDIAASIDTIRKRSKGMLSFIQDYRKIAKIPEPSLQEIKVLPFFEHIQTLMQAEFEQQGINFKMEVKPKPLRMYLDQGLIEQVLINMIVNACQALQEVEVKQLSLQAYTKEGFKIIELKDNGHGIPEKLADRIFVPFFTTKNSGSGIGLSLSQQIMQKHGGSIDVESEEGKGARFVLKFKY